MIIKRKIKSRFSRNPHFLFLAFETNLHHRKLLILRLFIWVHNMSSAVTRAYVFNESDDFSHVFRDEKFGMVRFLDGPSLNTLSKVSKFFFDFLKDPLVWKIKARELGIDYSDARQEVRAFCTMNPSNKDVYMFVKNVIGPLVPTDFRKFPERGFVKSRRVRMNWPLDATVIVGTKYETYLHNYMPYIAFSVVDRSFYEEQKRVILVIEKTTKVTDSLRAYLNRLVKGEPCGLWHDGAEKLPKTKKGKSVIELSPPPNNDSIHIAAYSSTFIFLGW